MRPVFARVQAGRAPRPVYAVWHRSFKRALRLRALVPYVTVAAAADHLTAPSSEVRFRPKAAIDGAESPLRHQNSKALSKQQFARAFC